MNGLNKNSRAFSPYFKLFLKKFDQFIFSVNFATHTTNNDVLKFTKGIFLMAKNSFKKLLLVLLAQTTFSCIPATSTHATTTENYTEMGLALATIPLDIAGHHYTIKNKKKGAAWFYLLRDIVSVLNKGFYFYNYANLEKNFDSLTDGRDGLANSVFLINDFIGIFKNIQAFRESSYLKPIIDDINVTDVAEQESISRLEYTLRVAILPSLKGLTAFALALAQDQSRNHSCNEERYTATAAHSLTRLVSEYSELEASSSAKKPLAVLIIMNIAWLAYELKHYIAKQSSFGPCPVCYDDKYLTRLECGHTYCGGCIQDRVDLALRERNLATMRCPHDQCNHPINEEDIRNINNSARQVERFRTGLFQALPGTRQCPTANCGTFFTNAQNRAEGHHCNGCNADYCARCLVPHQNQNQTCNEALQVANPEYENWLQQPQVRQENNELWENLGGNILGPNGQRCPQCTTVINKIAACNHMTCGQCQSQFCYLCGANWAGHRCANPHNYNN